MNISGTNNNYSTYTPSFGKKILANVNLKQRNFDRNSFKFVKATISTLDVNDPKDTKYIDKINKYWKSKTSFSNAIVCAFREKTNPKTFFMTELNTMNLKIKNKIVCLMKTTSPENCPNRDVFQIDLIQSAPAIAERPLITPIKGAGEVIIYGAVKMAKENGFKKVELLSANDRFYEKIGFIKDEKKPKYKNFYYYLPQEKYDNFIENVEKKYKF